jgi:ABC-type multidrug transport system fused ATPase/permease subunit
LELLLLNSNGWLQVYRHALKLTSASRQGVSTGEVVNLFSNDALKVEQFMRFVSYIIVAPIQIAVCMWLIYLQVGDAMFVGVAFMMFIIPIQAVLMGNLFKMQKRFIGLTDKRVNIMNEILTGIRVVKFYSWEEGYKASAQRTPSSLTRSLISV